MSIGDRLKSERNRLQLSQASLADLLSVGKTTVINWEKGASAPDGFQLDKLSQTGADALFILTGQVNSSALSPDESTLLQMYRAATPSTKGAALGALLGAQQGIDQVIHSLSGHEVQIPAVDNPSTAAPKPARKPATKTSK